MLAQPVIATLPASRAQARDAEAIQLDPAAAAGLDRHGHPLDQPLRVRPALLRNGGDWTQT